MAEPLVNRYGPEIPQQIAEQIKAVDNRFDDRAFMRDALAGYDALDLMARGRHLAQALHQHLPDDYEQAITLLVASFGERLERDEGNSMAPFLYLPHSFYISQYGLGHFEASMQAMYQLTQRFTAEFCIRPFLEQHTQATLERLHHWAEDDNEHIRRLVSEGCRPRLPWASRLRNFQKNPAPVLALLEKLKDDPALYVRRSVANNLNDIGKDHPDQLLETAADWLQQASTERLWIVRHALRSQIKQGHPQALKLMGFGEPPRIAISQISITPATARIGDKVQLAFTLTNTGNSPQNLLVDFCVHYVKANGKTAPKVFKLKSLQLAAGESISLGKKVSLAEMTTRQHYAGTHSVELLINGQVFALGRFELV